jgi:hypothetical protein
VRRWLDAAGASAGAVAVHPELWLPGALAWVVEIGWIPFVVAVARPPSVAQLTFLGAGMVTSGGWPWNAVQIGVVAVALLVGAFTLVAIGNAVLFDMLGGRRATSASVARLLGIALVAALPAALFAAVALVAAAIVAPGEFNAVEVGAGPVVGILLRLAPLLAALALAIVIGAAFATVAGRGPGIEGAPRELVRIGRAGWAQVVLGTLIAIAYLGFAGLLLSVLWAPIGVALAGERIDLATGLLLVGFVAIWLCLVAAGGALHAWSASTWSRLLATDERRMQPERTSTPA